MQNKLFTPIEEVFFRSSKIGLLVAGLIHNDLTEIQRNEMQELQAKKIEPIGLTDNQKLDYEKLLALEDLTEAQSKKFDTLKEKLTTPKGLTLKQQEKLDYYKEKDGAEPALSQGAKTYIQEVWLENEKKFREDFSSKHTRKGIQAEEDSINLVSFVDNKIYTKNIEKAKRDKISGTCDIKTAIKEANFLIKVIDDVKSCWNPKTFMAAHMNPLYEWQGRSYLYIYDYEVFRLRYCLVDCPPDVYQDELKKFCFQNNILDETNPEYSDLIQQFENNFLYTKTGRYTQAERVKTFSLARDIEKEKIMLKAVELAVEYYKTISLNGDNK